MDHRGAKPGAVAPVFVIDVLDHLLAPLMLEIHVDIGRLFALFADETFKQQVMLGRVHRRDAQHITDGRVGGRATPLTQDRGAGLFASEPDDILNG